MIASAAVDAGAVSPGDAIAGANAEAEAGGVDDVVGVGGSGFVPGDRGGEPDVCEAGADGMSTGSAGIGACGRPEPGEP